MELIEISFVTLPLPHAVKTIRYRSLPAERRGVVVDVGVGTGSRRQTSIIARSCMCHVVPDGPMTESHTQPDPASARG